MNKTTQNAPPTDQGELERLQAENAELHERFQEQGQILKETIEENESMGRVVDAGGNLTAMLAENKRLLEDARVAKARVTGLTVEVNELKKAAKYWMNKHDRLEKKLKDLEAR